MSRSNRSHGPVAFALLVFTLLGSSLSFVAVPASAADTDWDAYAEVGVVEVLSSNEDDSIRTTKVWLAVVDGRGYIRTSNTRWGANVVRNPDIVLRIGEEELELRAHFIEDEALRELVVQAFREKYGLNDKLIGLFRSRNPKIMRLDSL